ncbi:MAG TPA: response regulator [Pyrinomonadaceae bacterium]|nr:response regulator [Pyrinomonadaceae bacterium]
MQNGRETRKVVLVVDDYEEVRILLRKALEMRGCRVVEAADGREAVEVALRERPDLILMDVWLPHQTGISAVQQIRQEPSMQRVPVIALTAYEAVDLHIKAIQAGCDQYMVKPINLDDLFNLLNRYLPETAPDVT